MNLFIEALKDTLETLPFLLITFVLIELFEHKFGKSFDDKIKKAGKFGPIIGAFLGILPQCGFSVMAVAFYSQGLVTLGTLISIFIATSDEALPILISTPGAMSKVLPFILTKIIFAILWGYVIDALINRRNMKIETINEESDAGCCNDDCLHKGFDFKDVFYHSAVRTLKIGAYILIITFAINGLFTFANFENLKTASNNQFLKIIAASIFGLIPNCAVSVGLVEIYLHGAINFGAIIAGLSSNAGMALLVLYKEEKNKLKPFYITGLLLICSIATGIILTIAKINI